MRAAGPRAMRSTRTRPRRRPFIGQGRTPAPAVIHPERTGDPAVLRWVVHGVELPFVGPLLGAPGLDELFGAELTAVEAVRIGGAAISEIA